MGTFALRSIKSGELIKNLVGRPCTQEKLPELCAALKMSTDDALQVDHEEYLILEYDSKVINHCCDPNAGFRVSNDLYAIRDINPGEEITCDYSTTVGINDTWTMSCKCGSEVCRGSLGNFLTLPFELLQKYQILNALPRFIREQLSASGVTQDGYIKNSMTVPD